MCGVLYVTQLASHTPVTQVTHILSPFSLMYCTNHYLIVTLQQDSLLSFLSADDGRCIAKFSGLLPYQIRLISAHCGTCFLESEKTRSPKEDSCPAEPASPRWADKVSARFLIVAGGPQIHLIDVSARNIAAWLRWDKNKVPKQTQQPSESFLHSLTSTASGKRDNQAKADVSSREINRTAVTQVKFLLHTPRCGESVTLIFALLRSSEVYVWDATQQIQTHLATHPIIGGDFDSTDVYGSPPYADEPCPSQSLTEKSSSLDLFYQCKWSLIHRSVLAQLESNVLKHLGSQRQTPKESLIKFSVCYPLVLCLSNQALFVLKHDHQSLTCTYHHLIGGLDHLQQLPAAFSFFAWSASEALCITVQSPSLGTLSLRTYKGLALKEARVLRSSPQDTLHMLRISAHSLKLATVSLAPADAGSSLLARVLTSGLQQSLVGAFSTAAVSSQQPLRSAVSHRTTFFRLRNLWQFRALSVILGAPVSDRLRLWASPIAKDGTWSVAAVSHNVLYITSVQPTEIDQTPAMPLSGATIRPSPAPPRPSPSPSPARSSPSPPSASLSPVRVALSPQRAPPSPSALSTPCMRQPSPLIIEPQLRITDDLIIFTSQMESDSRDSTKRDESQRDEIQRLEDKSYERTDYENQRREIQRRRAKAHQRQTFYSAAVSMEHISSLESFGSHVSSMDSQEAVSSLNNLSGSSIWRRYLTVSCSEQSGGATEASPQIQKSTAGNWSLRRFQVWPQCVDPRLCDIDPVLNASVRVVHWIGSGRLIVCGLGDGSLLLANSRSGAAEFVAAISNCALVSIADVSVVEHRALLREYLTEIGANSPSESDTFIKPNPCHDLALYLDVLKLLISDSAGRRVLICLQKSRSRDGRLRVTNSVYLASLAQSRLHVPKSCFLCLSTNQLLVVDHMGRIVSYSLPHGSLDFILEPGVVQSIKESWTALCQRLTLEHSASIGPLAAQSRPPWKSLVYQTGVNFRLLSVLFADVALLGANILLNGFRSSTSLGIVRNCPSLNQTESILFANLPHAYKHLISVTGQRNPHMHSSLLAFFPLAQMVSAIYPWNLISLQGSSPPAGSLDAMTSIRILRSSSQLRLQPTHRLLPYVFIVPGAGGALSMQYPSDYAFYSVGSTFSQIETPCLGPPCLRSVYGRFSQTFLIDVFWALVTQSNSSSPGTETASTPSELIQHSRQTRLALARAFCSSLASTPQSLSTLILSATLVSVSVSQALRDAAHYLLRHITLWHMRAVSSPCHSGLDTRMIKLVNMCHLVVWLSTHDRVQLAPATSDSTSLSDGGINNTALSSPNMALSDTEHSTRDRDAGKSRRYPSSHAADFAVTVQPIREYTVFWPKKIPILKHNDYWLGTTTSLSEVSLLSFCALLTAWHTCVLTPPSSLIPIRTPNAVKSLSRGVSPFPSNVVSPSLDTEPSSSPGFSTGPASRQVPNDLMTVLEASETLAAEALCRLFHHPCAMLRSSMGIVLMPIKRHRPGAKPLLPRVRTEAAPLAILASDETGSVKSQASTSSLGLSLNGVLQDPLLTFKVKVIFEMIVSDLVHWKRVFLSPPLIAKFGSPESVFTAQVLQAIEAETPSSLREPVSENRRLALTTEILMLRVWLAYAGFPEFTHFAVSALLHSMETSPILTGCSFAKIFEIQDPPIETCKCIVKCLGKACLKCPGALYYVGKLLVDGVIVKAVDQFIPRLRRETIALVTLLLYELESNVPFFALSRHTQRLAMGASDGSIIIWQLRTGLVWRCLTGHKGSVTAVAFSADGNRLVSFSPHEVYVKVWCLAPTPVLSTLGGTVGFRQKSAPLSLLLTPKPSIEIDSPTAVMNKEVCCRFRFKLSKEERSDWSLVDTATAQVWKWPASALHR
eukprot:Gregarina_sp_Poly_1__1707@NODE_143_length_12919_cov_90_642857_g128_i0_p1_GENE_NODE_143_length_12919_cov_90_642857_g128_i0NODE_143_length_12919_cov_90_642857_g128_i0_p1_ORF_typecomplete_len1997_score229_52ANAPC4_WD40/PF12894_7/9_5e02ANAPC4_WD40/PF12894_7/5_2e03ANAPC4_WD40/PF12894_7/5_2ANAPC4_WD40/PF12894_7/1_3e07WD40/PF00400_32/1_9e03WD40/PF00400_32/22WD40/PF00400_32/1_1e05Frtz/PF11768_8/1_1e02Frtz/PF11768_8/0_0075WD40_like/PF17005_5/0_0013Ge1_WD40/PF16529_5/2_2Ge1_WD40/PF16529_5/2GrpE/PF01025_19